jgi:hypothetical protein
MMEAILWYDGRRLGHFDDAVAVETDGDEVEILTEDGREVWDRDEWDDLTVKVQ